MTNEEIAKAAYDAGFSSSEMFKRLAAFKRMIDSIAAAEREACAELCELWNTTPGGKLAAAIRARGNHA